MVAFVSIGFTIAIIVVSIVFQHYSVKEVIKHIGYEHEHYISNYLLATIMGSLFIGAFIGIVYLWLIK